LICRKAKLLYKVLICKLQKPVILEKWPRGGHTSLPDKYFYNWKVDKKTLAMSLKACQVKAVRTEVNNFLSTASAHGLGYFVGNTNIIERFFWAATTFLMLGVGIVWIDALRYVLSF
jgi:hypothetical protein